ncbi:MAG: sporulation transcriptional regulator SpoIIID [Bacilli bacterium]
MNNRIYNRVISEAKYIILNDKTIRETSYIFGVSKSTVHKDMRDRLYLIDKLLYEKVSNLMKYHTNIKHIRGGESTKRKFLTRNV